MNTPQQRPFAVVTGASSGIGFELAKVFAEEGFDLLITAEDEEIEAAQRELNQIAASVECTRVDLSTEQGVVGALEDLLNGMRHAEGAPTPPLEPTAGGPLRARELATGVGQKQ